jgi:hypothetical protein
MVFKIWLRNLSSTHECNTLLDIYYQSADYFILVYDTHMRESFEALQQLSAFLAPLKKRMLVILGISDPNKNKV